MTYEKEKSSYHNAKIIFGHLINEKKHGKINLDSYMYRYKFYVYMSKENDYTSLADLYVKALKDSGKSVNEIAEVLPKNVKVKFLDKEMLIEENRKRSTYLKEKYKNF